MFLFLFLFLALAQFIYRRPALCSGCRSDLNQTDLNLAVATVLPPPVSPLRTYVRTNRTPPTCCREEGWRNATSCLLCLCCCCFAAAASKLKARQAVHKKKTCGASKPARARTTIRLASRRTSFAAREGGHPWYAPCHGMVEQHQHLIGFFGCNSTPPTTTVYTQPAAQHGSAVQCSACNNFPKYFGIIFTKRYYWYNVPILPGNARSIWVSICMPTVLPYIYKVNGLASIARTCSRRAAGDRVNKMAT